MDSGHVVLAKSHRRGAEKAERVGPVDPRSRVEVTVTLRGPKLPPLDTTKRAISRADYERDYGASPDDVALARKELERYGLSVDEVSAMTRSIRVSGTAAQIEEAFHPGMAMYSSKEQGEFRGREGDVHVPKELEEVVTGVFGLDQRRVARRGQGRLGAAQAAAGQVAGLGPGELEQHYNFPPGRAAGQKIAIAEFGGAYYPGDLEAFCQQHGLALNQPTIVEAGMKPPSPEEVEALPEEQRKLVLDEAGEVMMDVEIVAALCQEAEIFVYFTTFDQKGWIDLINMLIAGKPAATSVMSVSWGFPEDSGEWSEAALLEVNQRLEAAAHLGITVCAASGDDGSGDQIEDGRAHVNFPATSPYVLSVGGTMLEGNEEAEEEVVWRQGTGKREEGKESGATGGGVSVFFDPPPWQTVEVPSLNPGAKKGRVVPDIAALAGPPFYDLVFLGQRSPNGGTSAATPLWASLIARMLANGKPTKGPTFMSPLLYEQSAGQARGALACTDVTQGDNTSEPQPDEGYKAGQGYDAVSGWGVPNGQQLQQSLQ